MPKFVVTFENARPLTSTQDTEQHMAAYRTWLKGLGDSLILPRQAFRQSRLVQSEGVAETKPGDIMGLLMIEATDMDAAVEVVQDCPFLDMGTMRVAEAMDVLM